MGATTAMQSGSARGTLTGADPQALEETLEILGATIQGRDPRRPRTGATRTRKTPGSPRRRAAAARRCLPALWRSSTAWSTWCCALRGPTRTQPRRVSSSTLPQLLPQLLCDLIWVLLICACLRVSEQSQGTAKLSSIPMRAGGSLKTEQARAWGCRGMPTALQSAAWKVFNQWECMYG